jgi:hypothetical protein
LVRDVGGDDDLLLVRHCLSVAALITVFCSRGPDSKSA